MTTLLLTISVCVGCGAENTTIEPTETATETTTEESTPAQTEEATAIPEETAEQTTEVTEEASEEVATETDTTPEPTVEPEPTEEPTPEPQATYTYTDMSATMYAQQTVNVRDLPDTSGNKLGSLSTNDEIKISAKCNETGWYQFEYNGSVAFVSNKYVGENKVEIQQASADNNTANSGSAASSNYEKNVWYDMGDYFFIMCNSEEESDNYYMSCFDNHDDYNIRATLKSRYPDRNTIVDGGRFIVRVSALHKTAEGFPNWAEIKYAPEVVAELHR